MCGREEREDWSGLRGKAGKPLLLGPSADAVFVQLKAAPLGCLADE